MKKVQWNSFNKKQNGLKQSKNEKSTTLPRSAIQKFNCLFFLAVVGLIFMAQKTEGLGLTIR